MLAATGCSSEAEFTTDVSGNYTIAFTNRTSTCQFMDWVEGKETSGVGFVIAQDGRNLSATVDNITAAFLNLALGSAEFRGTVERSAIELTAYGTRQQQQGACTFTYNATVVGELNDDALSGTITYAPAPSDDPACDPVECKAMQDFSGSRPPR